MPRLPVRSVVVTFAVFVWVSGPAAAAPLAIYDIQYTADADGASPQDGNLVDCLGGVVTHTSTRTVPRVYLQDPAHPDGWGAVMVKDWTGTLLGGVQVGDWVSLANVRVEEFRGNTILQYEAANSPGYTVESTGNPVPAPRLVSVAEIAAPVEGPADYWLVADHAAEPYEAMHLTVADVTVTDMDLGKNFDNYVLHGAAGDCWATDYLNDDNTGWYHSKVFSGQHFQSVTGLLEQYTRDGSGWAWDYYQLMTTSSDDLVIPEPMTIVLLQVGVAVLGWTRFRRRGRRRPRPEGSAP